MKIEFSKKQFWHLMRAVYLADWMANAVCDSSMKKDQDIIEIQNYIFSFAEEAGYGKYVDYLEDEDIWIENSDLDDEPDIRGLIERYDEKTTWEELAMWLADRDFFNKFNREEIKNMDQEECFMKRMECQIYWENEFENFGIERFDINDIGDKLKQWHRIKNNLIENSRQIYFHEREIWWCSLGKNVGFEQNGKGREFTRPIVVLHRLSLDTCLAIPLTTSKNRKNLFSLGKVVETNQESFAMLEQIRLIDAKRFGKKICVLDSQSFKKLLESTSKLILGDCL